MAYVEIEKVLETARDGCHSDFGRSMADLTSLREVLEDTPTADVVEVVRCKACKHWHERNNECYFHAADENGTPAFFRENDFCSYGTPQKEG